MQKAISIVVPTYNEEGSIGSLIERFAGILEANQIEYELIFIDDYSTDQTREAILAYTPRHPVRLLLKKGQKGKAFSIMEGAAVAKFPLIAIIDADLQYPPEAIPLMMNKIGEGFDVVVANRKDRLSGLLRNITSMCFHFIFARFLHGFSVDVQSGLKVFKAEIIKRINLHPTPWTFDLEFLIKARDGGYKIESLDIIFSQRLSGESKVDLLKTSLEIGLSSIKARLISSEIIRFLPERIKKEGEGFHYKGSVYKTFNRLNTKQSALFRINNRQKLILISLAILIFSAFLINWHTSLVALVAFLMIIYFNDLLFNFYLITRSLSRIPELHIKKEETEQKRAWPNYSIFCPLYKEWEVVPQFITAMRNLDYPRDKLQILLLLESDDRETINRIEGLNLPPYFQTVIVPHSFPKTKPKACNFGLKLAIGEFSVIYDAEDIPDPDQLKKAVIAFEKANKKISCIQAKLSFYNPHQNVLTRVFTGEYSLWFDLILPGLQSLSAPIPLGGTSNHFRTSKLRHLQGWDVFNVTEDCDLGIRLTRKGFLTAMINSQTLEEANSSIINWFPQRVRWIKGYIQTYLVHTRSPKEFIKGAGLPGFIMFQMIVGGKVLSMFINPLMWITTAVYFLARPILGPLIESFFLTPIFYIAVFSLVFGNFLYLYNYMVGCMKKGQFELVKYAYLVPFYWIGMSIAAWMALIKVIQRPFYWAKTPHGLHLNNTRTVTQAEQKIGGSLVDCKLNNKALAI